jgi:uncharacterized protein
MSSRSARVRRPADPLRVLLALLSLLALAALLYLGLAATERALAVWSELERLPAPLRYSVLVIATGFIGAGLWLAARLWKGGPARAAKVQPIDRPAIEARLERLQARGDSTDALKAELQELDRRRQAGVLQIALFGEISAGKSSLLKALVPEAAAEIDVRGGSTTEVRHYRARLDGLELEIADVPGTRGIEPGTLAEAAQAEAARAHALIYVADSDLSRSQDAELRALARFGRPLILALNKSDRYSAAERAQLLSALGARYADIGAEVLALSAGRSEQLRRLEPDGSERIVQREAPPDLGELPRSLQRIARLGASALEPAREAATLAAVDARLASQEARLREREGEEIVRRYTRRALVAALATVAPGTDLLIQGGLAAAMLNELAKLHGRRLRELDTDRFISAASGRVRSHTAVLLAIAGNALKAFPGLGTLGGGLVHALAYGLLFDALGRAAAQALAEGEALDREATLQAFENALAKPRAEALQRLARTAIEAIRAPDSERSV